MPIEDGISKATKNLDKAAGAAPTSQVEHATDQEKKKDGTDEGTQDSDDHDEEGAREAEDEHDDSDD